ADSDYGSEFVNPVRSDTMSKILPPSRRQFLRGAGVALALPWLESIPLFAQDAGPAAAAAAGAVKKPPLRFGVVYFSNGVEPEHWWGSGEGAAMELGPVLQPMMPHREDIVVMDGLFHQSAYQAR